MQNGQPHVDPDLVATLTERLEEHGEWYEALVTAALEETHDLAKAIERADQVIEQCPEQPDDEDEEDEDEPLDTHHLSHDMSPIYTQLRAQLEKRLRFGYGLSLDATGHEHKGKGKGGGQFTSSGTGGAKSILPDEHDGKTWTHARIDELRGQNVVTPDGAILKIESEGFKKTAKRGQWEMWSVGKKSGLTTDELLEFLNEKGAELPPELFEGEEETLPAATRKFDGIKDAANELQAIRDEMASAEPGEKLKERVDAVGAWLAENAKPTGLGAKALQEASAIADKLAGGSGKSGTHIQINEPEEEVETEPPAPKKPEWKSASWQPQMFDEGGIFSDLPENEVPAGEQRHLFSFDGNVTYQFAVMRAPKGGVSIDGKKYTGGQFIPNGQMAKASPEQREQIEAYNQGHKDRLRKAGPPKHEHLRGHVADHAHHELSKEGMTAARRTWAALKHHHQDLVMHRLSELIMSDKETLASLPEGDARGATLQKRLRSYGHMLDWAEKDIQGGKIAKHGIHIVPLESVAVDPVRFQYKLNTNKTTGAGEELKEVSTYRPEFGGVLLVWHDPKAKKDFVVNGHHRYELARRAKYPVLAIHYIQAATPELARAIGAQANIAEGRGTAIDAAKYMRDTGTTAEDMAREGISLKGAIAKDSVVLTGLSDRLFSRLTMGLMKPSLALAVAGELVNHDEQEQLFKIIDASEAKKKKITDDVAAEMAREIRQTPRVSSTVDTLFGAETTEGNVFVERCQLKSWLRDRLGSEVTGFKAVSTERRAKQLERGENVLNIEKNRAIAQQAERMKLQYDASVNYKNELSAVINDAAEELFHAPKRRTEIQNGLWERVRAHLSQALGEPKEGSAKADEGTFAGDPGVQRSDDGRAGGGSGGGGSGVDLDVGMAAAAHQFGLNQGSLFGGTGWERYLGPRGGKGWRSLQTGRIIYQIEEPGHGDHEGEHHEEAPAADEPAPVAEADDVDAPEAEPEASPETDPREAASAQTQAAFADEEEYIYARQSDVPNAGEDLLGSARHIRNAWRGLEGAEEDGTAAELITRDKLLKNEPHNLMANIEPANCLAVLAAHLAIQKFPSSPESTYSGRDSTSTAEKRRKDFYDAFAAVKAEAEKAAVEEVDPSVVLGRVQKVVKSEMRRLRGQKSEDYVHQVTGTSIYNPVANQLVKTFNALSPSGRKKADAWQQVKDFGERLKVYGVPSPETLEKAVGHVGDVIEGDSFNKTFGSVQEKGNTLNAADLYVKKAERKGGPVLDIHGAVKATAYMTEDLRMRGVQWGNTVTDEEREHHAKFACEAFADLTDILGLSSEAASLGGQLGLAIGARGKGTASAHYEPTKKIINLTRKSGVGSLAHEWGHFFDHLMGGGKVSFNGSKADADYYSEMTREKEFIKGPDGRWVLDDKGQMVTKDLTGTPIRAAYDQWRAVLVSSGFKKRLGQELSAWRRKGMSDAKSKYWYSTREVFARCFERYVQQKLRAQDRENTYLTGLGDSGTGFELWPNNAEVEAMTPHFDAIFAAHKHQTTAQLGFGDDWEPYKTGYLNTITGEVRYPVQKPRPWDHKWRFAFDESKHPRGKAGKFAPKGGAVLSGQYYHDGEDIPDEAHDKATDQERSHFIDLDMADRLDYFHKVLKPHAVEHGHMPELGGQKVSRADYNAMTAEQQREFMDAHRREAFKSGTHPGELPAPKSAAHAAGRMAQAMTDLTSEVEDDERDADSWKEDATTYLTEAADSVRAMLKERFDDDADLGDVQQFDNTLKELASDIEYAADKYEEDEGSDALYSAIESAEKYLKLAADDLWKSADDAVQSRDDDWTSAANDILEQLDGYDSEEDRESDARAFNQELADDGNPNRVWKNPDGEWEVINHEDIPEEHQAAWKVQLAHAPAGYTKQKPLRIAGQEYVGGEFIPNEVVAQAPPEVQQQLKGGGESHPKGGADSIHRAYESAKDLTDDQLKAVKATIDSASKEDLAEAATKIKHRFPPGVSRERMAKEVYGRIHDRAGASRRMDAIGKDPLTAPVGVTPLDMAVKREGERKARPSPLAKEPHTPPPPGKAYTPNVEDDPNGDGITDHARVGVHAMSVPPPPPIERLPNLTPLERAVEGDFMDAFQADPHGVAAKFRKLAIEMAAAKDPPEPPTFGTDDAKMLHTGWNGGGKPSPERSALRATLNTPLHGTANAIAKRAFVQHLNTLKAGDELLVTVGGCGAGKGYALENVPKALEMKKSAAAVWDSAGDQNANENPWIQREAEARGLKVSYVYVHADPKYSWADPTRGVIKRANNPKDGRMVDAMVFADSYAIGAKNHQAFYEANRNNPSAKFVFLVNQAVPVEIPEIPREALAHDREELTQFAYDALLKSGAPEHIIRGARIGKDRIWAAAPQQATRPG